MRDLSIIKDDTEIENYLESHGVSEYAILS